MGLQTAMEKRVEKKKEGTSFIRCTESWSIESASETKSQSETNYYGKNI